MNSSLRSRLPVCRAASIASRWVPKLRVTRELPSPRCAHPSPCRTTHWFLLITHLASGFGQYVGSLEHQFHSVQHVLPQVHSPRTVLGSVAAVREATRPAASTTSGP